MKKRNQPNTAVTNTAGNIYSITYPLTLPSTYAKFLHYFSYLSYIPITYYLRLHATYYIPVCCIVIRPMRYTSIQRTMSEIYQQAIDQFTYLGNYSVLGLFRGCGKYLKAGGLLLLYGPFAYDGLITPSSNVEFDRELKMGDPLRGLRDVDRQLIPEASKYRIRLETKHQLPSNNQLLVWKKY